MKMINVAIYARCSTAEQNTTAQREELVRYANQRGWQIYKVYEENRSGASGDRPQFQALMSDARKRKIDIVLCLKLDRMYRSTRGMLQTLDEFQELGVEFVSVRDQIDLTTSAGKLMASVLASVAEFERDLITERVRAGVAHAKAKGVKFGRPQTRKEGQIQKLHKEGMSYRQICQTLGVSMGSVQRSLTAMK